MKVVAECAGKRIVRVSGQQDFIGERSFTFSLHAPGRWSRSEQGLAHVALSISSPHDLRAAGVRRLSRGAGGVASRYNSFQILQING